MLQAGQNQRQTKTSDLAKLLNLKVGANTILKVTIYI